MAENLQDLRRRIKSVTNTSKITQAMKMVSAAKLSRCSTKLKRIRPMKEKIESLMTRVSGKTGSATHTFLEERQSGDTIIVAIASDKGLCGSFNTHIINKTKELFQNRKNAGENPSLIPIGNKIYRYFLKRDYTIDKFYGNMMTRLEYTDVKEFSAYLQEIYLDPVRNIRRIEFLYTQFISSSQQKVAAAVLFPIKDPRHEVLAKEEAKPQAVAQPTAAEEEVKFIFEPTAAEIFNALLPLYIDTIIYRILLESAASEHAARMIAMNMAARNAEEMIGNLILRLNKLRQASITRELLEIITATEALTK
ncbi:MAG: ATP synthase F1 subunit gamma [Candidatus Aminicenantes bacterium]|nr:ATP synthase F1 subunit gamma [Candidatus Aminicenantes bacterium]